MIDKKERNFTFLLRYSFMLATNKYFGLSKIGIKDEIRRIHLWKLDRKQVYKHKENQRIRNTIFFIIFFVSRPIFLSLLKLKKISNYGKKLFVIQELCPQSHKCPSVDVCPVGALSQVGFNAPVVDNDKCIRCGKCCKTCPMKALVLKDVES